MKRQIMDKRRVSVDSTKMLFVCSTTFLCFLSSPQTHKKPAKQLSRLGFALSNEHGFSFIAQTFTILFAMYPPAVWQRPPLYQRDIFWLFFSFSRLQCCVLEGGGTTWQISFTLCPQQSWLHCSNDAVLFAGKKMKRRNQLIARYSKPTRHMPVFAVFSSATV